MRGTRAQAYALIAVGLREPVPEVAAALRRGAGWRALARSLPPWEAARAAEAAAAFRALRGRSGRETLARLHFRLFSAPGAVAPPYGSLYLEGCLMGETTAAALAAYREAGLAPAAELRDLPDHAALEAEFLATLAWREEEALAAGDAAAAADWRRRQAAFLREHLGRWFPAFAARVAACPEAGPYGPLVAAARAFLAAEGARLAAEAPRAAGAGT